MTAAPSSLELAQAVSKPYPNDRADHRLAPHALPAQEIDGRRQIEQVAAQRRALPLVGEAGDYAFLNEAGATLQRSDLFDRRDTLVSYFWMHGPARDRPCPMCTAFLGALDTPFIDLAQRVAVAVLGWFPVARPLAVARERAWVKLHFHAAVGDDFACDCRGLAPHGSEWPALDVWGRRDGPVRHFWASELGGTEDEGQEARRAGQA